MDVFTFLESFCLVLWDAIKDAAIIMCVGYVFYELGMHFYRMYKAKNKGMATRINIEKRTLNNIKKYQ